MKYRQIKKLSKRVFEIAKDRYGRVLTGIESSYVDEQHFYVKGIMVSGSIGQEQPLFWLAREEVFLKLAKDDYYFNGECWVKGIVPVYHKRLTGMEVIKQLRKIIDQEK